MAKIACCYNCAYAFLDQDHTRQCISTGVMNWPACANHPDSYGRMRRTPERGICPNYRPRPATPDSQAKQIPLGNGVYTYVDAADYPWLNQWTWSLKDGYAVRLEKHKTIYMHRQIMQPPPGMIVDHKNLNKLDNSRVNLWVCTHQENACNRSKKRGTVSRFRGVSYARRDAKYLAQVYYKGETFFCGYHTEELEAARARDYKAVEVLGESARLNFPEEWPPDRRAEIYTQFQAGRKSEAEKAGKEEGKKAGGRKTQPAQAAKPRNRGKGRGQKATRKRKQTGKRE